MPYTTSNAMRVNSLNYDMINVKIEDHDQPKIRKKICRKMLSIFTDEFNIQKKDAKKLTLHLESRFNLLYSFKNENYVTAIKKFFANLRSKSFSVEDQSSVTSCQIEDFSRFQKKTCKIEQ